MTIPAERPGRTITGMSAILLIHRTPTDVDWDATAAHVRRTSDAGLTPAVNMDTGYVQQLDGATIERVLDLTAEATDGAFVAGAYVRDQPGDRFDVGRYVAACESIASRGGTPVIFPSYGLNRPDLTDAEANGQWIDALAQIGRSVDEYIGFELGPMFVPYGRVVDIDHYRQLVEIPSCIGAKHSSLQRTLEWDRLAVRDAARPDFKVFTGNDLAIDMVRYGSDYLLGLSTMAPEAFAKRDALWAAEDPRFHELNDLLQYLGMFTFRAPVPCYRHNAATVAQLRGWAATDAVPPGAPQRPSDDRDVLADIVERLQDWE